MATPNSEPPLLTWGRFFGLAVVGIIIGTAIGWYLWGDPQPDVTFDVDRGDPAAILDDPNLLFDEPSLLADAIESRVNEEVAACMDDRGFTYRQPSVDPPLDTLIEPDRGPTFLVGSTSAPDLRPLLPLQAEDDLDDYETALYGAPLQEMDGPSNAGGCAAQGELVLEDSLATLAEAGFTYGTLLELSFSDYEGIYGAWTACMLETLDRPVRDPDFGFPRPEQFVAALAEAPGGTDPNVVIEFAAADRGCREVFASKEAQDARSRFATDFVSRNEDLLGGLLGAGDE